MDTKTYKFSVSSIKEFEQCGLKFKLGRIDKVQKDPESTHHRWIGKVVHASIYASVAKMNLEEGFKSWELTGDAPDIEKSKAFFDAAWDGTEDKYLKEAIALEAGPTPSPDKFIKGKIKALMDDNKTNRMLAWRTVAWEMVQNGVKIISKLPKILHIEKKILLQYKERTFTGYVDIIAEGSDGKVIFLDFKTSWQKPSPVDLDSDIQFIFYSYALKEMLELPYNPVGFYVHLKSTTVFPVNVDEVLLDRMDNMITKSLTRLDKGLFFHNKGSYLCPYCDFYSKCYGEEKVWP